jgi:hypothetical protein
MPNSPNTPSDNSRTARSRHGAYAEEDWLLYPELIDHLRPDPAPGWWARLRRATARHLADPTTAARDRRRHATRAVRRYQRQLGFRAWRTTAQRVAAGWWYGPAPYGYQLRRHHDTDDTDRRAWRHRLVTDAHRASVVPVIFAWYVQDKLGDARIAARLAADPRTYPPPLDPVTGQPCPWTPTRVRTILAQPAYLGHVVWARTRHGRPQPETRWHIGDHATHPALITPEMFWTAYHRRYPNLTATDDVALDWADDTDED